ncbi:chromatin assembly factor 1 subunit A-domain-containing protein [Ochromonadaceae sp. CCMP2298]|nr:chromatin assembly factor 1 subunit A-domain-containing protein [Ochromonadaceae sp. CCMP2298]
MKKRCLDVEVRRLEKTAKSEKVEKERQGRERSASRLASFLTKQAASAGTANGDVPVPNLADTECSLAQFEAAMVAEMAMEDIRADLKDRYRNRSERLRVEEECKAVRRRNIRLVEGGDNPYTDKQDHEFYNKVRTFSFFEDHRPPYVGTISKKSLVISGRNPFAKDTSLLNYDYDSEEEWEDDVEGDDLDDSDEMEEDEEAGDWLVYDDFCCEDDYRSDGDQDACTSSAIVQCRVEIVGVRFINAPAVTMLTPTPTMQEISPVLLLLTFPTSPWTMLVPGSCFSYRARRGEGLLFAQLSERIIDDDWLVFPLMDYHNVWDLIPSSQNPHSRSMDDHIRIIPRLVREARPFARQVLTVNSCIEATPVLVINEHWFQAGYLFYRAGMTGVFCISWQFDEISSAAGGQARRIDPADFPIGERLPRIFADLLSEPDNSVLGETNGPVDALFCCFKFRASLADQFSKEPRKNAGLMCSMAFDLRCSSQEASALLSWPGLLPGSLTSLSQGAEVNRVSFIVTESTILTPAVVKNLVVLKVHDPRQLHGFLGDSFRYFPICEHTLRNYRAGGFSDMQFACIASEPGALIFSFDLSSDTMFVTAKVEKLSREQAGALPQVEPEDSYSDASPPPTKKKCT